MNEKYDHLEYWITQVSQELYKLIYAHDWLSKIFADVSQELVTQQQIDFMLGALGGENRYRGKSPRDAHTHIYITDSLWREREALLLLAFEKSQCPLEISQRWIKIDEAFKKSIVTQNIGDLKPRFPTDEIIIIKNPKFAA